jgi:hypothetical protein
LVQWVGWFPHKTDRQNLEVAGFLRLGGCPEGGGLKEREREREREMFVEFMQELTELSDTLVLLLFIMAVKPYLEFPLSPCNAHSTPGETVYL